MTITLTWGLIPLLLVLAATALMIGRMVRPYQRQGDYDFGGIFRLGWLIPIGFLWAGYFGGVLLCRYIWGTP